MSKNTICFLVAFHWDEVNPSKPDASEFYYEKERAEIFESLGGTDLYCTGWDPIHEFLWLSLPELRHNAAIKGLWEPKHGEYVGTQCRVVVVPDMLTAMAKLQELTSQGESVVVIPRYNTYPHHYMVGLHRAINAFAGSAPSDQCKLYSRIYHEAFWYEALVAAEIPTPRSIVMGGRGTQRRHVSFDDVSTFFGKIRDAFPFSIGSEQDRSRYFLKGYKAVPTISMRSPEGPHLFEAMRQHRMWLPADQPLMIREWVDLLSVEQALGRADRPTDKAEWRFIFHGEHLLAAGPNCTNLDKDLVDGLAKMTYKYEVLARKAHEALPTAFNAIDIALDATGEPLVIECNMGIAAGLPTGSGPNFYENLFRALLLKIEGKAT